MIALSAAILMAALVVVGTSMRGDVAPLAVVPVATPVAPTDAAGDIPAPSRRANATASPPRSALDEVLRPAMPTPGSRATAPKTDPSPLPPADTPLVEIVDALTRRAEAGDPAAACRLAAELVRCSHRAQLVASINSDAFRTDPESKRHLASSEHRGHERLAEANRICAGVPAARINEAFRRTMDAADLGHPGARSWIVMYGDAELARHLFDDPDAVQRWLHNVPRWVITSLEEGDWRIGASWASVAGSPFNMGPTSTLLESDPGLRLALLRFQALRRQREGQSASRLLEAETTDLMVNLPRDVIALAESAAHRWVAAMGPQPQPETTQSWPERLMARCNGM